MPKVDAGQPPPKCSTCGVNNCKRRGGRKHTKNKDKVAYAARCRRCSKANPITPTPSSRPCLKMKPVTGTYVGNGKDTHYGFRPDLIVIKQKVGDAEVFKATKYVDGKPQPASYPSFRLVRSKVGVKKEMVSNCGKQAYTKKDAQTAANKRRREGVEYIRIYPCPFGDGGHWHLTHQRR